MLATMWMQQRIDAQIRHIQKFNLDKSLIAETIMHEGRHEFLQRPIDSPSQLVLEDEGLQFLSQMLGVESIAGFEKRSFEMELGIARNRKRFFVHVMAVPSGFFKASGLGDDSAEKAVQSGKAIIPSSLQNFLQLRDLEAPAFILQSAGIQKPKGNGSVAVTPSSSIVDTAVEILDLNFPDGMAAFKNTIFIGLEHEVRFSPSIMLPQSSIWIQLKKNANTQESKAQIAEYLKSDAPLAFKNSHIQLQDLSEVMAGKVGVKELEKFKAFLLFGCGLLLAVLISTIIFMKWGDLLKQINLRRILGQVHRIGVTRTLSPFQVPFFLAWVFGSLISFVVNTLFFFNTFDTYLHQSSVLLCLLTSSLVLAWIMMYLLTMKQNIKILQMGTV